MSQEIQFYTIKIFSDVFLSKFDGETNPFIATKIYQCLQVLFEGTETKSKEYREEFFEDVELDYLSINSSDLAKIKPDFNKELKFIFDNKTDMFSFVDETLWLNLEKIIFEQTKKNFSEDDKKKSLKANVTISQDYKKLLELFQKSILFIGIF